MLPLGWARDYMLRLIRELESIARSSDPWIGAQSSEAAVVTSLLLESLEIVVTGAAHALSDLPPELRGELELKLSKALSLVQSASSRGPSQEDSVPPRALSLKSLTSVAENRTSD